jgi:hypothetical protein
MSRKAYGVLVCGLPSVIGDLGSNLVAWSFRRIFHRLIVFVARTTKFQGADMPRRRAAIKIRMEPELEKEFEPGLENKFREGTKKDGRNYIYIYIYIYIALRRDLSVRLWGPRLIFCIRFCPPPFLSASRPEGSRVKNSIVQQPNQEKRSNKLSKPYLGSISPKLYISSISHISPTMDSIHVHLSWLVLMERPGPSLYNMFHVKQNDVPPVSWENTSY